MTTLAQKDMNFPNRSVMPCRNYFALGIVYWLLHRPIERRLHWIRARCKAKPEALEANTLALKGGYHYGENAEVIASTCQVRPAPIGPGEYRNITGNTATALGFVGSSKKPRVPILLGSSP